MLNKNFPQMNFHPKIVLIYALLSLKCRKSNLRAFLKQKLEFCPSFCPSNARIFAKKVPVFRPSFLKYGPVWRIGYTAQNVCRLFLTYSLLAFAKIGYWAGLSSYSTSPFWTCVNCFSGPSSCRTYLLAHPANRLISPNWWNLTFRQACLL